jgi:succinate dehydrogenase/fumarate reductase flavoprotein subunit
MESEKIKINNYTIDCYRINTLVIGSGAASLNAAVSLHSMGQEDIIVATSEWGGGTSNNAGSDKQTYYKLSLSGDEPDSVSDMAGDLFNGRCMHGDIALCEAQGSVQAFMKLISLGVRFPHDKFGAWAGYKTDHDPRSRATSAGPYTSKRMFEVLAAEINRRNITVLDNHHCISLLTDRTGLKVIGALAINTSEKDYRKAFVMFNSTNVILGTGGPAGIYETSAYPVSQSGSTGMALKAGATAQNLTESQFGIASLKFRWNLSGSYQQVVPRYISTDKNGNDKREFLNEFFPDIRTLSKAIFLKGYQWPFDAGKIRGYGSSLIDLLVFREIDEKGRHVFIDYSENPSWNTGEPFSLDDLDSEVNNYLRNSGAYLNTPFERLCALNEQAIAVYFKNGIDLAKEPVQIAVCAQHNNGGLKANIWWESDLRHLFPVGEVNGSHGVKRPGGSALNSGQVGSFRAAQYISKKYAVPPPDNDEFIAEAGHLINFTLAFAEDWISSGNTGSNNSFFREIRKRMSKHGGIIRIKGNVAEAAADAFKMLDHLPERTGAVSVKELSDSFLLLDNCITHYVYLEAIKEYTERGGRSRGSYIVAGKDFSLNSVINNTDNNQDICLYDRDVENRILEVSYKGGKIVTNLTEVRGIPNQDLLFERVWKDYLQDNYLDC